MYFCILLSSIIKLPNIDYQGPLQLISDIKLAMRGRTQVGWLLLFSWVCAAVLALVLPVLTNLFGANSGVIDGPFWLVDIFQEYDLITGTNLNVKAIITYYYYNQSS